MPSKIQMKNDDEDYDANDDLFKSIREAFRVIRERMKSGGLGWEPHKYHPLTKDDKQN